MKKFAVVLVGVAMLAGCTATQKGATFGSILGAGAGAIIGHQTGNADKGAIIGGALGAGAGAVVGNKMGQKYFCPVCGKQYEDGANMRFCPADGAELKPVQK
jgi:phage tail tape-measure protein